MDIASPCGSLFLPQLRGHPSPTLLTGYTHPRGVSSLLPLAGLLLQFIGGKRLRKTQRAPPRHCDPILQLLSSQHSLMVLGWDHVPHSLLDRNILQSS